MLMDRWFRSSRLGKSIYELVLADNSSIDDHGDGKVPHGFSDVGSRLGYADLDTCVNDDFDSSPRVSLGGQRLN